jgi:hypothetical protein
MTGVAAGDSGLVAVGHEFTPEPWEHTAAIWVSTDGVSWERIPNPEDGAVWLRDVEAIGGSFIAVGTYEGGMPAVWESTGSAPWSVLRLPCPACDEGGWSSANPGLGSEFFAGVFAVASGEHGIAAVGVIDPDGERPIAGVWLSADGTEWELATTFDSSERTYTVRATAVAWDGDRLVVVGHEESDTGRLTEVVWVSPDAGSNWFEVGRGPIVEVPREDQAPVPTGGMGDVVPYGPGVVVVSGAGYSWVGAWSED